MNEREQKLTLILQDLKDLRWVLAGKAPSLSDEALKAHAEFILKDIEQVEREFEFAC